jgi:hypothetical protein
MTARFSLGQIVGTPGALVALAEAGRTPLEFLRRHSTGDWGDVDEEDRQANEQSLLDDSRILSAYKLSTGERLWIITEADRSSTTLLLPSEY